MSLFTRKPKTITDHGAGRRDRSVRLVVAVVLLGTVVARPATAETPADAMTACWRKTALAGAAANCDPPEVVVDATYHACIQQEVMWHNVLIRAGGPYGGALANTIYARVKQSTHTVLLSFVTKARADKGLCK